MEKEETYTRKQTKLLLQAKMENSLIGEPNTWVLKPNVFVPMNDYELAQAAFLLCKYGK